MVCSVKTTGILLNATQPVWLWISWANEALTAGTGNVVGNNSFLFYADVTPIAKATTAAVSSFTTDTVEFTVPYNQEQSATGFLNTNFSYIQLILILSLTRYSGIQSYSF